MAKNIREVFGPEQAGEQKITALEAVKEGIQTVAQRLSLKEIFGEIKDEMKEQLKHGSHELASALFTGNGYVQYARKESRDEPEHGLPEQQQEQDRGGREM
jgi:hypothetical protein